MNIAKIGINYAFRGDVVRKPAQKNEKNYSDFKKEQVLSEAQIALIDAGEIKKDSSKILAKSKEVVQRALRMQKNFSIKLTEIKELAKKGNTSSVILDKEGKVRVAFDTEKIYGNPIIVGIAEYDSNGTLIRETKGEMDCKYAEMKEYDPKTGKVDVAYFDTLTGELKALKEGVTYFPDGSESGVDREYSYTGTKLDAFSKGCRHLHGSDSIVDKSYKFVDNKLVYFEENKFNSYKTGITETQRIFAFSENQITAYKENTAVGGFSSYYAQKEVEFSDNKVKSYAIDKSSYDIEKLYIFENDNLKEYRSGVDLTDKTKPSRTHIRF